LQDLQELQIYSGSLKYADRYDEQQKQDSSESFEQDIFDGEETLYPNKFPISLK